MIQLYKPQQMNGNRELLTMREINIPINAHLEPQGIIEQNEPYIQALYRCMLL